MINLTEKIRDKADDQAWDQAWDYIGGRAWGQIDYSISLLDYWWVVNISIKNLT